MGSYRTSPVVSSRLLHSAGDILLAFSVAEVKGTEGNFALASSDTLPLKVCANCIECIHINAEQYSRFIDRQKWLYPRIPVSRCRD